MHFGFRTFRPQHDSVLEHFGLRRFLFYKKSSTSHHLTSAPPKPKSFSLPILNFSPLDASVSSRFGPAIYHTTIYGIILNTNHTLIIRAITKTSFTHLALIWTPALAPLRHSNVTTSIALLAHRQWLFSYYI